MTKTAATPAQKARLAARIASMEDVLKRWRTYARDEYLDGKIAELQDRIDEARAERAAMDGGGVDASQYIR